MPSLNELNENSELTFTVYDENGQEISQGKKQIKNIKYRQWKTTDRVINGSPYVTETKDRTVVRIKPESIGKNKIKLREAETGKEICVTSIDQLRQYQGVYQQAIEPRPEAAKRESLKKEVEGGVNEELVSKIRKAETINEVVQFLKSRFSLSETFKDVAGVIIYINDNIRSGRGEKELVDALGIIGHLEDFDRFGGDVRDKMFELYKKYIETKIEKKPKTKRWWQGITGVFKEYHRQQTERARKAESSSQPKVKTESGSKVKKGE